MNPWRSMSKDRMLRLMIGDAEFQGSGFDTGDGSANSDDDVEASDRARACTLPGSKASAADPGTPDCAPPLIAPPHDFPIENDSVFKWRHALKRGELDELRAAPTAQEMIPGQVKNGDLDPYRFSKLQTT